MDYGRGKGMCNEYFQPGFTIPAADGASISNGQNILYFIFKQRSVGIITGNPGVFQSYPDPYPTKPVPMKKGKGYCGLG